MRIMGAISQSAAEKITELELPRSVEERRHVLRKRLPYGAYVLSDGSEVLYNRDYEPIDGFGETILDDNGKPMLVEYESQFYFYDDDCEPLFDLDALNRVSEATARKKNNPRESVKNMALKS